METKDLDIVYCVKTGENNEELRHSLRSLVNLPHRKVWIFGYVPSWVQNVEKRPKKQVGGNKWEKTADSLWQIATEEGLTDDFILFNDDFFVMNPQTTIPYWYDRTLRQRVGEFHSKRMFSAYTFRLDDAREALEKRGKTIWNYELHLPMIFNREKYKEIWKLYPGIGAKRSLYGNEYNVGGKQRPDCKIYQTFGRVNPSIDFISTSDGSYRAGEVGRMIRKKFNERSIYECPTI